MSQLKKVVFVHIPKTAGTSVRRYLNLTAIDLNKNLLLSQKQIKRDQRFLGHDPLCMLLEKNDLTDAHIFSFVRNPYTRTYSFYQFLKQNNRSLQMSFMDFLDGVRYNGIPYMYVRNHPITTTEEKNDKVLEEWKWPNNLKPTADVIGFALATFTQSFYLYNNFGEIQIDKIYKFEKLSDFEKDFDVKLATVNTTFYNRKNYLEDYTPKHMAIVKQHFAIDFINFGYSTHFDDSAQ